MDGIEKQSSAKSRQIDAFSPDSQWPNLRFLGLGVWWGWIWLCYIGGNLEYMVSDGNRLKYVLAMYLASTVGIALSMLVASFGWKKATSLVAKRPFVVAAGAFASLATLGLGYFGETSYVLFVVLSVATGIGTSAICLRTGFVYGEVDIWDSLASGVLSLLVAVLLFFACGGMPQEWRIVFTAALPIAAALLISMRNSDPFASTFEDEGQGEELLRRSEPRRKFRRLVIASSIVAFTSGVGKGIASLSLESGSYVFDGAVSVLCIGLLAIVLFEVISHSKSIRSMGRVYSALMVMGIVLMLLSCFGLSISFLTIGKEVLWLVFTCLLAYMAFRFRLSSVRLFGIGQAAYFLSSTAGWFVGSVISPYYSSQPVSMCVGMGLALLVVVTAIYVFPEGEIAAIASLPVGGECPERGVGCSAEAAPPFEAYRSCDRCAFGLGDDAGAFSSIRRATDEKYGLSIRELEVLEPFAQGRSANWIADDLGISKNTVRSHLRAIYTKLDVHSRQELLDLLGE